jgi:cupin 2 domain-containing protein
MTLTRGNLYAELPTPSTGEVFDELLHLDLAGGQVRIERIVSSATTEPVLYDQCQSEWVLLLQGQARLWVADEEVDLSPGDYLFIPAHTPHRVVETSAQPHCIWLAVHLDQGGEEDGA